ncbi:hypothetical protein ACEWY4_007213 [Coilia grayii]|uniref:Protein Dr1 n=1 Tax=Coilia grayii TaxID=363190 RepID=A0ABD1KFM1_9TELE
MSSPSTSSKDDDLAITRSTINQILQETVPSVRVSNDARELVFNCCSEFLTHFSSVVSEMCDKSKKKMISPSHVFSALESLGFESYIPEVEKVLQDCKTVARKKTKSRLENHGIPEDELLRQQQDLFAQARQQQAQQTLKEWRDVQLTAQQAQESASAAGQQDGCSTHQDEEEDNAM